jgi:glycosyltransferase involved in cell wall biosynthesis
MKAKKNGSVSIVIPTHDRYQNLRNLLSSIRENWDEQIESVIVVDDSGSKSSLGEFEDLKLRHITLESRAFISKAKNIGWRISQSEFVYFIDDDNVINSETLAPVLEKMRGQQSLGAVMPAVFYRSRPDLVWVYATPFLNRRFELNLVGRNMPRNPSLENRLLRTDALPNASLVRRIALEDAGGFDEKLVINSSLDFVQRLKARCWRVASFTGGQTLHDVEAPGRVGWWATHGSADPARVRFELRDWFLIMKRLHGSGRVSKVRSAVESLRFVAPNLLAYLTRGSRRPQLVTSLMTGYIEGLFLAS